MAGRRALNRKLVQAGDFEPSCRGLGRGSFSGKSSNWTSCKRRLRRRKQPSLRLSRELVRLRGPVQRPRKVLAWMRQETSGAAAAQAEIEEVLREASRSPRIGLMLLSAKMERAARDLATDIGLDLSRRPVTLSAMIRQLVQAEQLTDVDAEALNLFNHVRNRIVHGHDAGDDEIARAIDSGTRLLRLLLSRPRPPQGKTEPD